jgi:hypothetical protein
MPSRLPETLSVALQAAVAVVLQERRVIGFRALRKWLKEDVRAGIAIQVGMRGA